MKKINDMWEDAAANSVSGGGVALPADAVNKKKKKKAVYDGRTKEGRKFVERMLANRKARMERQTVTASKQNLASITVKEEPVTEAASSKLKQLRFFSDKSLKFTVSPRVIKAALYWRIEDDKGGLFDEVPVGPLGQKKFTKMYGEETVAEAKVRPPKIKGLSIKGSEITGLKQGTKTFSAKLVVYQGKLGYKVMDEFGGFETLDLKAFTKKFG